jgi:hypothetical protein
MASRSGRGLIARAGMVVATCDQRGRAARGDGGGLVLLQLPVGSTYAAGAAVLMATLADQTSLPWPDEFPRKIRRELDPA